jgi:hypothetical protein
MSGCTLAGCDEGAEGCGSLVAGGLPVVALSRVMFALGGCRLIIIIAPRMKQTHETINITACRLFFPPMYLKSLS